MDDRYNRRAGAGAAPATPDSPVENPLLRALRSTYRPSSQSSPQTPVSTSRYDSSAYDSPGLAFRADDEILVFEFDSRCMRAGLTGDPVPRTCLKFGPKAQSRTGDFNEYMRATPVKSDQMTEEFDNWGRTHELWRSNIHSLNLSHVFDKVERATREAITGRLLMHDGVSRRLVVALPSQLPQQLLSTLLMALFNFSPAFQNITLLPSPIMCVVAAGLRSSLVIDIGWHETVVTAVFEYREILQKCTCRGMKMLSWEMKQMLEGKIRKSEPNYASCATFEEIEDITTRLAWCPIRTTEDTSDSFNKPMTVSLSGSHPHPVELTLPFSDFSVPIVSTLFGAPNLSMRQQRHDDHETPIAFLAYLVLLRLPIDLREHLLHRIVVTGYGSDIPGLTGRIMSEISSIIEQRSWNPVHNYGSVQNMTSAPQNRTKAYPNPSVGINVPEAGPSIVVSHHDPITERASQTTNGQTMPSHLRPQYDDATVLSALRNHTIYSLGLLSPEQYLAQHAKSGSLSSEGPPSSSIRAVRSLGPWAGASLISGLKIPGIVQISRDEFLRHGLNGASRDTKKVSGDVKTRAEGGNFRDRLTRKVTGDVTSRKDGGGGVSTFTLGSWA